MREIEMAREHDRDTKPVSGGFEHQRPGIITVDSCWLQLRAMQRLFPVLEDARHVAMDEKRVIREVFRHLDRLLAQQLAAAEQVDIFLPQIDDVRRGIGITHKGTIAASMPSPRRGMACGVVSISICSWA